MSRRSENTAVLLAWILGVLTGLVLAAWWRVAQIEQNQEVYGEVPETVIGPHNKERK